MLSKSAAVFLILAITASMVLISGCSTSSADQEYIDFADTAAEEYLVSINERDYVVFSKHLGEEMLEELPEESFLEFADQVEGIVGNYIDGSKEFSKVEKNSGFISIVYDTKYTEEPAGVIFTLVLQKVEGQIKISGSWFNSPKLRGE
jgi:protein involved in sex pheromone biosynthesis